jgi:hypothetical protein
MRLRFLLSIAAIGCASAKVDTPPAPVPETVRVMGSANRAGTIAMGVTGTPATARSFSVLAPAADVWRALPAAYESLGIPISTMDSATCTLGNAGFNVRRQLGSTPPHWSPQRRSAAAWRPTASAKKQHGWQSAELCHPC